MKRDVPPLAVMLGLVVIAAYGTHIYWIIWLLMTSQSVPFGKVILAVVGLLVPPLAVVHGGYLWFNNW